MAKKIKYDNADVVVEYALKDGGGNTITTTYATKTELQTSISSKLDKAVPTASQGEKEYLYTFAGTTQNTDVALVSNLSTSASLTDKMVPSAKSVTTLIESIPQLFIATYNVTTFSDISDAVTAGKFVVLKDSQGGYSSSPLFAPLVTCNSSIASFGTDRNGNAYYTTVSSDNTWNRGIWELEKISRKVSAITGNETSTDNYPNTKAVYDYAQAKISSTNKISADYIENGSTYIMIPALPSDASTKTYTLQAVNGVLTWVETTWN